MSSGVCRFCDCTDQAPCAGGCGWADDTHTLCTACATAAAITQTFLGALNGAGVELALAPGARLWEQLGMHEQRLLIAACAELEERWTGAVALRLEAQAVDALAAAVELELIAGFLAEAAAHELRDGESVSEMVERLLAPHLGRRIIVPGS